MSDLQLSCQCKTITGVVRAIKPGKGMRLVCYCSDCQTFAKHLAPAGGILNQYGGTQILQIAPSMIEILQGQQHLRCTRLTRKGLYRWHSACCDTPIANTVSRKIPFVGLAYEFISDDQDVDGLIGPVVGTNKVANSIPGLPDRAKIAGESRTIKILAIAKIILWKLLGKSNPNPFYANDGRAVVKPQVLEV